MSAFMRRLLTGYAVSFNLRHQRSGHLFQNRYKSIVCQEDAYFKELVRYIHLNPLRASIIPGFDDLESFPWTGHSAILGNHETPWMAADAVLKWFGSSVKSARNNYLAYMRRGIDQGRRPELVGGGLIRSKGGWSAVKAMRSTGDYESSDARILGDGEFVSQMMDEIEVERKRQFAMGAHIDSAIEFIQSACHHQDISYQAMVSGSRARGISGLRKELTVSLFKEFGLTKAEIARQLGVTTPAVVKILQRLAAEKE